MLAKKLYCAPPLISGFICFRFNKNASIVTTNTTYTNNEGENYSQHLCNRAVIRINVVWHSLRCAAYKETCNFPHIDK